MDLNQRFNVALDEDEDDDYIDEQLNIKSQGLVDSNNEESTDNDELNVERMAKFTIGDSVDTDEVTFGVDKNCDNSTTRDLSIEDLRRISFQNEVEERTDEEGLFEEAEQQQQEQKYNEQFVNNIHSNDELIKLSCVDHAGPSDYLSVDRRLNRGPSKSNAVNSGNNDDEEDDYASCVDISDRSFIEQLEHKKAAAPTINVSMNPLYNNNNNNDDDDDDSLGNKIVNSNTLKMNDYEQASTCRSFAPAFDDNSCFEKVQQETTLSKQGLEIPDEANMKTSQKAIVKIRIEDCNYTPSTSGLTTTTKLHNSHDELLNMKDYDSNEYRDLIIDQVNRKLEPTFPGQIAPLIGSALDVRQLENLNNMNTTIVKDMDNSYSRLTTFAGADNKNSIAGSLSDNTCERSKANYNNKDISLEKKQMVDRLKNWKKSNKIITHIRENPFNMHMDFLERLSKETGVDIADLSIESLQKSTKQQPPPPPPSVNSEFNINQQQTISTNNTDQQQQLLNNQQQDQQQERLQTYAAHLSHLYRRNQTLMDNNSDFRTLLYNIICCLLIQDEQILSTVSVTKMIDVIRTHLESTSKFYSSAMISITNPNNNNQQLPDNHNFNNIPTSTNIQQQQQQTNVNHNYDTRKNRRKSSLDSSSFTSSNSGGGSFNNNNISNEQQQLVSATIAVDQSNEIGSTTSMINNNNHLLPEAAASNGRNQSIEHRRQKPVDFRRISSVSYNDEQLINDLCDTRPPQDTFDPTNSKSMNNNEQRPIESPWRFEELSSECKHHNGYYYNQQHNNHYTSQSSLENNQTNVLDLMNDSGIGTVFDFNGGGVCGDDYRSPSRCSRKRSYDVADYKPKQKPPYMSTDDYLSQVQNDSRALYDDEDEDGSLLNQRSKDEQKPVDVASRKAELEWTLNKLINFELKYTWLTGRDTLRRAIRKIGVPNEIRGKVWLILIDQMIGTKYDAKKLLEEASKTITQEEEMSLVADDETQAILKQIQLDVNRTMPGHKLFDDGAEGGIKLRRILVAYSIHVNRAIDHIFPSKFYFDHYLTGARADQFLLADFICDQLIKSPTTVERKMVEGVTSSITLNWFISLFHGAVPTLTRLTILDHFMLEGVKALFRFTMAILYLAFQVTPPSSCEVFTTIRNTAKEMYDIKLLLSIVEQIKLPKDSYFAIRRSFYMVQSSFNSDQFYMQSLSNDASRQLVSNKPLSVQRLPDTKPPAMSLITAASIVAHQSFGINGGLVGNNTDTQGYNLNGNAFSGNGTYGPRVCTSSNRTKVCIQNIGKMGRSHIKIMDANVRSNERSLMSPLRNCLVIGISNCGKIIIFARQSSKKNFKTFREQDLLFHVHEVSTEIFDGFYLEENSLAIIITHLGEIFKIDTTKCFIDSQIGSTETLILRDSHSICEYDKVKLRLASMDTLTNLLWIYIECEDTTTPQVLNTSTSAAKSNDLNDVGGVDQQSNLKSPRYRSNNPFLFDNGDGDLFLQQPQQTIDTTTNATQVRPNYQRKILIIDIMTFDIFSAFSVHNNFGTITNFRTSLVAFCRIANPMSNQFSSRIVRIGPTGRYEHLLSFSDVVDFMITVPESTSNKSKQESEDGNKNNVSQTQRYSTLKRLLTRSMSMVNNEGSSGVNDSSAVEGDNTTLGDKMKTLSPNNLTKYYRSLIKSQSTCVNESEISDPQRYKKMLQSNNSTWSNSKIQTEGEANKQGVNINKNRESKPTDKEHSSLPKALIENPSKAIITSYLGDVDDFMETNYMPVNMAFIFRNGKIALFEFTESYAIHTRESQLDRYDYSKIIEVIKNGEDFIITILTIYEKLIKVVI